MHQKDVKNSMKYQKKLGRAYELHAQGLSIRQIAKRLELSRTNIAEHLRKFGK